ncbi:MAG: hypothetical protein ABW184_05165 [Sphingobium sp.]
MTMGFARKLALAGSLLLVAGGAVAAPGGSERDSRKDKDAEESQKPRNGNSAGEIVTQPVRDVGLDKKEIPPILVAAVERPYAPPKGKGCAPIATERGQLDAVLGPDFGTGTKANEDKVGKVAAIGGSAIVNSLIPFRGIVREVSGAAPAERRFAAAVSAGMARRGYLRGVAQARGCKS